MAKSLYWVNLRNNEESGNVYPFVRIVAQLPSTSTAWTDEAKTSLVDNIGCSPYGPFTGNKKKNINTIVPEVCSKLNCAKHKNVI